MRSLTIDPRVKIFSEEHPRANHKNVEAVWNALQKERDPTVRNLAGRIGISLSATRTALKWLVLYKAARPQGSGKRSVYLAEVPVRGDSTFHWGRRNQEHAVTRCIDKLEEHLDEKEMGILREKCQTNRIQGLEDHNQLVQGLRDQGVAELHKLYLGSRATRFRPVM